MICLNLFVNHILSVYQLIIEKECHLSLIESASVGRAIVTTDMPGCREIVRDGVNGFIVPPKSSYELYKALKESYCQ
jgi:glycosyltransferase involved in cell wall biosynthesis